MLEVRALGGLDASYRGAPLQFQTQKVPELLCYLLLEGGRPIDRCVIAEALWPMRPPGKARRSLSTALWRLRQAIRASDPSAPQYIVARRRSLRFDTARAYRFDVEELERHTAHGLAGPLPCDETRLHRLEAGVRLYLGPLLDGTYSDWCLAERERLQLTFMRSLKCLLQHHRLVGAFDAAVVAGKRLLAMDPLQEDVHRELMHCFAASGQRAHALEQYERCRGVLRREINIEPMAETSALHWSIRGTEARPRETSGAHDEPTLYEAALGQFRLALDALETSWEALRAVPVSADSGTTSTLPPASS
jgi:DNA-binding SARP family transcriptional activator